MTTRITRFARIVPVTLALVLSGALSGAASAAGGEVPSTRPLSDSGYVVHPHQGFPSNRLINDAAYDPEANPEPPAIMRAVNDGSFLRGTGTAPSAAPLAEPRPVQAPSALPEWVAGALAGAVGAFAVGFGLAMLRHRRPVPSI